MLLYKTPSCQATQLCLLETRQGTGTSRLPPSLRLVPLRERLSAPSALCLLQCTHARCLSLLESSNASQRHSSRCPRAVEVASDFPLPTSGSSPNPQPCRVLRGLSVPAYPLLPGHPSSSGAVAAAVLSLAGRLPSCTLDACAPRHAFWALLHVHSLWATSAMATKP